MENLNKKFKENPKLEEELKKLALNINTETGEENPNFIYDDGLPNVSILMPTYNRRDFLPLILINIVNMDYPKNKLELVIYDDHKTNPLFLNNDEINEVQRQTEIKIKYIYNSSRHLSIGEKRNKLVKASSYNICINIDDDDIYFPSYIRYSVNKLLDNKAGLVGSAEMLFTYPNDDYKLSGIKCREKRQIHEASMCFKKKYWRNMGGFNNTSIGEGTKMIDGNEKNCFMTDIINCMICICHNDNTYNKDKFKDENCDNIDYIIPDIYKELINQILKLP
jgi:cellulose synthase/poly-beta-1,6-N-acetylglucosamine synthase-like glycosyltransferase